MGGSSIAQWDGCDMLSPMDSSGEVRRAAAMLLDACRGLMEADRYDPMNNPPRAAEVRAMNRIRQSIRYAERIEHLFSDQECDQQHDSRKDGVERLSPLDETDAREES